MPCYDWNVNYNQSGGVDVTVGSHTWHRGSPWAPQTRHLTATSPATEMTSNALPKALRRTAGGPVTSARTNPMPAGGAGLESSSMPIPHGRPAVGDVAKAVTPPTSIAASSEPPARHDPVAVAIGFMSRAP